MLRMRLCKATASNRADVITVHQFIRITSPRVPAHFGGFGRNGLICAIKHFSDRPGRLKGSRVKRLI